MKLRLINNFILTAVIVSITSSAHAESLFRANVSDNVYPNQPRSIYSSVKAKTIGDLITIIVNESTITQDEVKLTSSKSSSTTDNYASVLNNILPNSWKRLFTNNQIPSLNGFGGGNTVGNDTNLSRKMSFTESIMAQVVQVLPNGNLVVQGKKSKVNAGEKVDIILSGIVDPRYISSTGTIDSSQVANLQIAITGDGTVSNANNEGVTNRVIRYLY